jgi:DNA-binding response OmpR family regulator
MVLPGMSGKDIARWIKNNEKYKNIPIVFITALAQQNERETFKEEKLGYYLIKPFALDQLEAKVEELLGTPLSDGRP